MAFLQKVTLNLIPLLFLEDFAVLATVFKPRETTF